MPHKRPPDKPRARRRPVATARFVRRECAPGARARAPKLARALDAADIEGRCVYQPFGFPFFQLACVGLYLACMRCWRQSSSANRTKFLQRRRREPRACRIRQAAGISQNIRYDFCTAERGFGGVWCTPEAQLMPDLLIGAYSDGDSQILWEDGERVFRRGWRL